MPQKKAIRSDGRYQVSASITDDKTGKRIRKYFYGQTQREANEKKSAYLKSLEQGMVCEEITVSQWIDRWLPISSTSANARKNNAIYAEKIRNALGRMPIRSVRNADVQKFAIDMSTYSFSMVNKLRIATNKLFSDAIMNGYALRSPTLGVQWDYASKGTHRAIADWEKDAITEHWQEHRCGIWAMLMLYAGLRRGEALALEWTDVDLEKKILHVRQAIHFDGNAAVLGDTKTEAGVRSIPIVGTLYNALKSLEQSQKYVCGDRMTEAVFSRGWENYLVTMTSLCGRDFNIRTHDLRHTFCTALYRAGVGVKEAQYLMGHRDVQTTMKIYTHIEETDITKAGIALERFWG